MSQPQNVLEELLQVIEKSKPVETEKTITISADERRRIEQLIGKNISSGDELVRYINKCVSVSVAGVDVELTPYLLDRLKSRAIRVEFDEFMRKLVKRLLEEHAGLR